MKKIMSFLFVMVLMLSFSFVAGEDNNMRVLVNFKASSVGISVPTEVVFEDLAAGYISEKNSLTIENTGTVDMLITPELDGNYSGNIFSHLVFQNILTDPMTDIGVFQFEIAKPAIPGDVRDKNIYMYLDLTDYNGDTSQNIDNHETSVVFWATSP